MLAAILFTISLLLTWSVFKVLEAIYRFRVNITKDSGGGYYQSLNIYQWFALRYLIKNYEMVKDLLPQGGYNVRVYDYKKDAWWLK